MGAALQEWMLDQISNFELEKWLTDDNAIENDLPLKCNFPSENCSSIDDILSKENDYWLEEIPLFEEIQPLEELKTQTVHWNEDATEKENQEKFFNNEQNETATEIQPILPQPQDLVKTFMESTTLFFTDDAFYIRADPNVDFAFLHQEKEKTFCLPEEKSTVMELDQWESDTSRSETSSGSSCGASETSSNNTAAEEESNDPEWRPEVFKPSARRTKNLKAARGGKSHEDKVNRKKEQNKNAATRYRQKKKAEVHKILREEEELKKAKAKLTEKVFDIESEIKCLKGLMRDLFKAKGLI